MTNKSLALPGLIVWLAGLLIGSGLEWRRDAPAPLKTVEVQGATYQVLAVDFHVHSFPGDGALLPWDVAEEARRRGLDAVALTNHNHMLQWRLATRTRSWFPPGVIILPGEEVTSPGFHIAAVGVRHPIAWSRSATAVISAVHAEGGVAIAAHPGRPYAEAYDDEALTLLDGVEALHPIRPKDEQRRREIEAFSARARAAHPGVAAIGSSDFHREAPLGSDRTYVFAAERTEAGILDAVRAGRTASCDGHGHVMGNEPWGSLARASCEAAMKEAGRSPARGGGAARAFAVSCALVGLAAMVFPRVRQRGRRV